MGALTITRLPALLVAGSGHACRLWSLPALACHYTPNGVLDPQRLPDPGDSVVSFREGMTHPLSRAPCGRGKFNMTRRKMWKRTWSRLPYSHLIPPFYNDCCTGRPARPTAPGFTVRPADFLGDSPWLPEDKVSSSYHLKPLQQISNLIYCGDGPATSRSPSFYGLPGRSLLASQLHCGQIAVPF